jgi:hypothetical protein
MSAYALRARNQARLGEDAGIRTACPIVHDAGLAVLNYAAVEINICRMHRMGKEDGVKGPTKG